MRRWSAVMLFVASSCLTGCITPHTTHFPSLSFMPPEYERREAQIHDPYADNKIGPETFTRPLNFQQRPEQLQAKDRYFAALKRMQSGAPFPATSTQPRTTGKQYPEAVSR
jgi:hypothetical protein